MNSDLEGLGHPTSEAGKLKSENLARMRKQVSSFKSGQAVGRPVDPHNRRQQQAAFQKSPVYPSLAATDARPTQEQVARHAREMSSKVQQIISQRARAGQQTLVEDVEQQRTFQDTTMTTNGMCAQKPVYLSHERSDKDTPKNQLQLEAAEPRPNAERTVLRFPFKNNNTIAVAHAHD